MTESERREAARSGLGGTTPVRRAGRNEPFLAHRRGGPPATRTEREPEPEREFETVALKEGGDAATTPSTDRESRRERKQRELDSFPIARMLGLRLDYAENGVSRIHLPAGRQDTTHGPMEGSVAGTMVVAAGHFAASSVAPNAALPLVEFKLNLLSVVQGELLAIGEVVRKGRTLISCRIEIVEDNDRTIAVGLATYLNQVP